MANQKNKLASIISEETKVVYGDTPEAVVKMEFAISGNFYTQNEIMQDFIEDIKAFAKEWQPKQKLSVLED